MKFTPAKKLRVRNSYAEFHENPTNALSNRRGWTGERTDGRDLHIKYSFILRR
jgi:hypothetical protein